MKKYKLLTQLNYYLHKEGEIYDENYKHPQCNLTIGELAKKYPDAWELVEEEFVFPEKWYIYVSNEEDCKLYWDYFHTSSIYSCDGGWYYLSTKRASAFKPDKEFLEISIEQFKQYVLGMKEEQKEIVRWKLKDNCKKYLPALDKISPYFSLGKEFNFVVNSEYFKDFKEAGVLDLWFEPVYAEKPKYKVGDWVLLSDKAGGFGSHPENVCNKILKITEIRLFPDSKESFYPEGIYDFGSERTAGREIVRKATHKEIKDTLIKEAQRRGFKHGTFIKRSHLWSDLSNDDTYLNSSYPTYYGSDPDRLEYMGCFIYNNGVWAEMHTPEPEIFVNGYKAKFFDEYVKFGCQEISIDFLEKLYHLQNSHNVDITANKEAIKKLVEYFRNKK